tara:strand:- start:3354 stop:4076 length:723 start_codon:yes stop_codon:yes gene_type:complete
MYTQIKAAVEAQGLRIRAAFYPTPEDLVPLLENGAAAATLILVGNAGSELWPVFTHSAEYKDGFADPLDRWSKRLGLALAAEYQGAALFPFGGAPYHPFLSWAKRGDLSISSPLGVSLHPQYGLWHAFRFALSLPYRLEDLPRSGDGLASVNACHACLDQPCLSACPVDAFTGSDYRALDCARFLRQTPDHACNHLGCGARRACPVGKNYQYQPEHACFHMRTFVADQVERSVIKICANA